MKNNRGKIYLLEKCADSFEVLLLLFDCKKRPCFDLVFLNDQESEGFKRLNSLEISFPFVWTDRGEYFCGKELVDYILKGNDFDISSLELYCLYKKYYQPEVSVDDVELTAHCLDF
ncbi:hypothetical protein [Marinomonas lutimaris]|jgi:hypothetical protein|uniref:hypothetical protein n=1 Tax=Marinomonas lutimaris TaxID=2846746 RepID=UPI001CA5D246|nr:hypothetical protein [Marinomonas lutimaris]